MNTRTPAILTLGLAIIALSGLALGAGLRNPFVVMAGYLLLWFALARSRTMLRAIDAGDLPRDGRPYASFAWMLSMVGSGLAILAFARSLF